MAFVLWNERPERILHQQLEAILLDGAQLFEDRPALSANFEVTCQPAILCLLSSNSYRRCNQSSAMLTNQHNLYDSLSAFSLFHFLNGARWIIGDFLRSLEMRLDS